MNGIRWGGMLFVSFMSFLFFSVRDKLTKLEPRESISFAPLFPLYIR